MESILQEKPHRRRNALTGEWVFVSPHRTQRPWQGKLEAAAGPTRPAYDPQCYLCAGNARANGLINPDYTGTYAFRNDFSAFLEEECRPSSHESQLLAAQVRGGTSRVLCYSPRHDLSLAELPLEDIRRVVTLWAEETRQLGCTWKWVQIFENKGEIMGCSNPHPHGQVWAGDYIPNEPAKECLQLKQWHERSGRMLLLDYAQLEIQQVERVVVQNDEWVALVPWWAVWPFETIVIPLRKASRLSELDGSARDGLAAILQQLLLGYDRLFGVPFPYSMGWHGAPFDGDGHPEWTVHAHFYPPLLRSAEIKKFMVGFELLGEAQRDLTPEQAAQRLRSVMAVPEEARS